MGLLGIDLFGKSKPTFVGDGVVDGPTDNRVFTDMPPGVEKDLKPRQTATVTGFSVTNTPAAETPGRLVVSVSAKL